MFETINLFKELMTAKEIKKAEHVMVKGWRKDTPGIKVWYDDTCATYAFSDRDELSNFSKDLNDLGIEVEG